MTHRSLTDVLPSGSQSQFIMDYVLIYHQRHTGSFTKILPVMTGALRYRGDGQFGKGICQTTSLF